MTFMCIRLWGVTSIDLGSVESPFSTSTPRSTLTRGSSTYSDPIYGWNIAQSAGVVEYTDYFSAEGEDPTQWESCTWL